MEYIPPRYPEELPSWSSGMLASAASTALGATTSRSTQTREMNGSGFRNFLRLALNPPPLMVER